MEREREILHNQQHRISQGNKLHVKAEHPLEKRIIITLYFQPNPPQICKHTYTVSFKHTVHAMIHYYVQKQSYLQSLHCSLITIPKSTQLICLPC